MQGPQGPPQIPQGQPRRTTFGPSSSSSSFKRGSAQQQQHGPPEQSLQKVKATARSRHDALHQAVRELNDAFSALLVRGHEAMRQEAGWGSAEDLRRGGGSHLNHVSDPQTRVLQADVRSTNAQLQAAHIARCAQQLLDITAQLKYEEIAKFGIHPPRSGAYAISPSDEQAAADAELLGLLNGE